MADKLKPEGEGVNAESQMGRAQGGFRDCRRCIEFAL